MESVVIDFGDLANELLPSSPTPRRITNLGTGGGNGRRLLQRHRPIPLSSPSLDPMDPGGGMTLDPEMNDLLTVPLVVPILEQYEKIIKSQINPIIKDINAIKRYRAKPLFFWRDVLGISIDNWRDDHPPRTWQPGDPLPLWSKQREIVQALVDYRKVAVKSGHGTGKTFVAGGMTLYFAYAWHCLGMTTAPTFRQVRRALWGEIHWLYNHATSPLGGKLNQVSLDLGDKWFVEGFATDKPMENITGIHEENVFVIIDEAGGVADLSFEAIEGLLTSENTFVLYIGNPIDKQGAFADAFKPNSKFKTISISCYDIPNVKYARNFYPKLTSYQWVKDKEVKWGTGSNLFKTRVLGEFPEESSDTLIPIRYIEMALMKGQNGDFPADRVKSLGLDVARQGTDSSVFGVRYDSGLFRILDVTTKKKETETAGRMKVLYDEVVPKPEPKVKIQPNINKEGETKELEDISIPPINIDDIGVGGGVVDMLSEDEYPVNGINVSEPPDENDEETDHPELFLNKRAQYAWKLKTIFESGKIAIEDEELAFELSKIKVKYLRSGKIKISDTDEIKTEIKRSPDRFACCLLTHAKSEAESVRDLVRVIS